MSVARNVTSDMTMENSMNALTLPPAFQGGALPAIFGAYDPSDDLGAAISVGFAVIGYRGKTWSIKYNGEEEPLLRDDGSGDPLSSIDLVLLKAPNHLSKVWYEQQWNDGSNAPPDCASSNSIVPDVGVPKPQNKICLTCRWNQFGSRPAVAGQAPTKGKACGDNKRLAVVPLGSIKNEKYGGPMLLRTPAASLGDLGNFALQLKQVGWPYYAIGVRVSFDLTVSYPKFLFKALRPLTADEGKNVMDLRKELLIGKIIDGDPAPLPEGYAGGQSPVMDPSANMEPKTGPQQPVQQPPVQQPKPQDNVVAMQQPKPAGGSNGFGGSSAPVQQEVQQEQGEATGVAAFDSELDSKLNSMLSD